MFSSSQRFRIVRSSGLFDIHGEGEFADIVDTVKAALHCPVSVISILDEYRQVFIAHLGLPSEWANRGETPLSHSFCQYVVEDQKPFVVTDATLHERVRDNLAIRDLGVISYLGVPVTLPDGTVIGAIAAIDGKPREWTQAELDLLSRFGRIVSNQINTFLSERRWSHLFEQLQEGIIIGSVLRDETGRVVDWRYDHVNPAWSELLGLGDVDAVGKTARTLIPGIEEEWITDVAEAVESRVPKPFLRQVEALGRWFDGYVQPTGDDGFLVMFLDVTEQRDTLEALSRSEERLRLLIEAAKDYVIVTIDNDHRISSWSGGAEETFGIEEDDVLGKPFSTIFTKEDRQAGVPEEELREARLHGVVVDRRWHMRADGALVFLEGTVRPLPNPNGEKSLGFIKIARNATSEKRSRDRQSALHELGERLRRAETIPDTAFAAAEIIASNMEGASRAGYGIVDAVAETVEVLPDWCAPDVPSVSGLHHFRSYGSFIEDLKAGKTVVIGNVETDPRTASHADMLKSIGIEVLVNVPILDRGIIVGVILVHFSRSYDFSYEDSVFVATVADRAREAISRIRAEEHQQILNHEISHRLKNTMSMVQAIAAQTLKPVQDRAPVEAFSNRLHALAKAHEVLLHQNWSSARMLEVIDNVLRQLAPNNRYELTGPDLEIGPRSALSLALLMHELGTNALKYGAWSSDRGNVRVGWTVETLHGEDILSLSWREADGPPVTSPTGKGFGSRLIRLGLIGTGGVDIDYDPAGLNVRMKGLVSQLRQ